MVFRCFATKKKGFDVEAASLLRDLKDNLGLTGLESVRIFNRYDVEGVDEEVFRRGMDSVFSEPPCDDCYAETMPAPPAGARVLISEALPGQYDQRADSCAQCLQLMTCAERPAVAYAKVYVFTGRISDEEFERVSAWLINPVDSRVASAEKPDTIIRKYPSAPPVADVEGFLAADDEKLAEILDSFGLAMDMDDLRFMQRHYIDEVHREPTVTELKVIDTYWSDHCRHTTFSTHLDDVRIEDPETKAAFEKYLAARREVYGEKADTRPVTLMDVATIGAKALKKRGLLKELDVSDEINACSIHVDAKIDGKTEDWLLMFKNETHNHPTEIEPFGGAATCIGGAIRDPLSGRSYVYQAMRITGAADPTVPVSETIKGKLPQRKLTTSAAAGYSSYGNQIGLATGLVHELYHPGYVAKRLEIGAVVGAVPYANVVRETPAPGDVIILLGGRTGRDGCGGATGSSKTHNLESLTECAAEVQKGNAPEERKLQRLFRNPEAARLIKRCNDFGAGGVSVAIGELAEGLEIELDKVKKKYEGLDGTELAISESQERMAVVVAAEDARRFAELAYEENLEATEVARVTDERRMVIKLGGRVIVDITADFLQSNGAEKHSEAEIPALPDIAGESGEDPVEYLDKLVSDLNFASQRGLGERFDGSIGAGSVLMPFGGKTQLSPAQAMAALLPVRGGKTETCSVMSWGFDPFLSEKNPMQAARRAVIVSIAKLVASGCDHKKAYLTFQEYFEKLRREPRRWGKPLSALLGALDAQLGLGAAAIGGKDSMSGSFNDMDVPPTLVSFAIAPEDAANVISPEFKKAGSSVCLFVPGEGYEGIKSCWERFNALVREGVVISARAVDYGAAIGAIFDMSVGNMLGFKAACGDGLMCTAPGAIVAECVRPVEGAILLGETTDDAAIVVGGRRRELSVLIEKWESALESVFATRTPDTGLVEKISSDKKPVSAHALLKLRPRALIPVFPGTNCEYDTAAAVERAGGEAEILVLKNITPSALSESASEFVKAIKRSNMIILPGGFSGGDEPEGSGKFITSFFRDARLTDAVTELLKNRDGLMLGICNGFQALIKLGLVPYGEIRTLAKESPTLTFNLIGRHQSRYVTTRICSVASPWLSKCRVGELHTVPVSHGEGRFIAPEPLLAELIANGQVATQYCDDRGEPSMDTSVNPNGSLMAIEGIMSADGRVLGKMAHTERRGDLVARNIVGELYQPIFEGGVSYYL